MAANQKYDNAMRGVLFKQDPSRKTSDRAPDYTGNVTIEGTEYRLAGWIKEGRSGNFLSLAVSIPQGGGNSGRPARNNDGDGFMDDAPPRQGNPREQAEARGERTAPPRETAPKQGGFDDFDDDIPF